MNMNQIRYRNVRWARWLGSYCVLFAVGVIAPANLQAQQVYDPEHPEVQEMIERGLAFIMDNQSNLVGNRVMFGMAAYKAQVISSPTPKKHPLIDKAVESIIDRCTESRLAGAQDFEKMYASALACVFLLELDSEQYRNQIQLLLDHIQERQQNSGGWGYRSEPDIGDTSQMQYIALALWLANEKGYKVDIRAARDGLTWMIDNQESDGGWIYKYPPQGSLGINARTVRHPLVAAGLGTVYLYADLLGLVNRSGSLGPKLQEDADLPPDVVDVTEEDDPETDTNLRRAKTSFDRGAMVRSMNNGNRWFNSNFTAEVDHYNMYYLYGYERYAALREYVEGENRGVKDWYDQGVEFLKSVQNSDGSMTAGAGGEISASVQTSFAILFLTRSMSITIGDRANSTLRGGRSFDNNTVIREVGDRIVQGNVNRSVSDVLSMLENPNANELEMFAASLDTIKIDGDTTNQQLGQLRELITHENFHARLIAIKFLSRQRTLDNVPAFIFALTDPDSRIVKEADKALRFVSRSTDPSRLSDNPSQTDINSLRRNWKEWYFRVKPDGQLMNEPEDG